MSDMKHSKGPWHVDEDENGHYITDARGNVVAQFLTQHDAAHIVACVNGRDGREDVIDAWIAKHAKLVERADALAAENASLSTTLAAWRDDNSRLAMERDVVRGENTRLREELEKRPTKLMGFAESVSVMEENQKLRAALKALLADCDNTRGIIHPRGHEGYNLARTALAGKGQDTRG